MPTDIGEVGFATRSMFTNRDGLAEVVHERGEAQRDRDERAEPSRAAQRRTSGQVGAGGEQRRSAASPPRNRYAGMSFSHGDALTTGRP